MIVEVENSNPKKGLPLHRGTKNAQNRSLKTANEANNFRVVVSSNNKRFDGGRCFFCDTDDGAGSNMAFKGKVTPGFVWREWRTKQTGNVLNIGIMSCSQTCSTAYRVCVLVFLPKTGIMNNGNRLSEQFCKH